MEKFKVIAKMNLYGQVVYTIQKRMPFVSDDLDLWLPTFQYFRSKEKAQQICEKLNEEL